MIRSEDDYGGRQEDDDDTDSTRRRRTRSSYSFRGHPWSDDSSDGDDKSSKHAKQRGIPVVKEESEPETTRRSTRMYLLSSVIYA